MQVRTSELPVVIDVDETLITKFRAGDCCDINDIAFTYYGERVVAQPISVHIDLLKSYKQRGYEVTVWSANGNQWAKEVVTKLGLTDYVDIVASKPLKYVDDKPADSFMQRIYIA